MRGVFATAKREIPPLLPKLEAMLAELSFEEEG